MNDVLTDESTDVDLDADIPCAYLIDCQLSAEWDVRHPCCDAKALLCTTHKEQHQIMALTAAFRGPVTCEGCGFSPMAPPTFRKL